MWWRRYEDNSLYIDYFPPSTITLSDGFKLTLKTDYPENGELLLEIEKAPGKEIPIYLRVPAWSSVESVEVTGNPLNRQSQAAISAARIPGKRGCHADPARHAKL